MTSNSYIGCLEAQSHLSYSLGSTHESHEEDRYERDEADNCHESEEEDDCYESNEFEEEYSCHANEGPEGMRVRLQEDEFIDGEKTSTSSI